MVKLESNYKQVMAFLDALGDSGAHLYTVERVTAGPGTKKDLTNAEVLEKQKSEYNRDVIKYIIDDIKVGNFAGNASSVENVVSEGITGFLETFRGPKNRVKRYL